ncbi:Hypothetical protein R9X50_00243300 [Acrodontium crateriforme]|uniref:Uncharacterized protein n=1 Tax=Acrodontium crateriforme TaxID=150365 RepID=A0AAQ3R3G8_9PEZI|nr:Hypothetical protein R9X50_00243300 [Acrodontium crateriforme]
MRLNLTPPTLLHLITAFLLAPQPVTAGPHPALSQRAGFNFNELFARWDCGGTYCGYSSQLCCTAGSTCYTDSNDQAQCGGAAATAAGGYWQYYTTTYTQTDLQTITKVVSSYMGGQAATSVAAATTAICNTGLNESPCGNICCASGQYCFSSGQCASANNGGSSGYVSSLYTAASSTATQTAGAPVQPTSSSTLVVTQTQSPTTTIPFETPVATGANITITSEQTSGSHLSGGAIAGIVIGVLFGLALLGLICFYCCIKGILDGLLALFGVDKRKRRTTEVEEYERRSHHTSGGGGRTWYGASRPSRVSRVEEKNHEGRNFLGFTAGLAALWAVLGLKRRRERRKEEEYSEYSEYSYDTSQYTSPSSASSDRRTRDTRRTRSQSRYSRR